MRIPTKPRGLIGIPRREGTPRPSHVHASRPCRRLSFILIRHSPYLGLHSCPEQEKGNAEGAGSAEKPELGQKAAAVGGVPPGRASRAEHTSHTLNERPTKGPTAVRQSSPFGNQLLKGQLPQTLFVPRNDLIHCNASEQSDQRYSAREIFSAEDADARFRHGNETTAERELDSQGSQGQIRTDLSSHIDRLYQLVSASKCPQQRDNHHCSKLCSGFCSYCSLFHWGP